MTARKPLATGDDGSGNRYPVREWEVPLTVKEAAELIREAGHEQHVADGAPQIDCPECVPASLRVPTPERFDPPCAGDEA